MDIKSGNGIILSPNSAENREPNEEARLKQVHVFISTGRFHSFAEMRFFIDQRYTDDGDGVPSAFMREIELTNYEPGCIEAFHAAGPEPLVNLLSRGSYADQWLAGLDVSRTADSAICVFAPNQLRQPHRSSLEYLGSFNYQVQ